MKKVKNDIPLKNKLENKYHCLRTWNQTWPIVYLPFAKWVLAQLKMISWIWLQNI